MKLVADRANLYSRPPDLTPRILLFGDAESIAVLNKTIGDQGYALGRSESLSTSLSFLKECFEQVSSVIIDAGLPWAEDLCEAVKSAAATWQIPVLILRHQPSTVSVEAWIRAGADEVIDWPSPAELVRKRVQTLAQLGDTRKSLNEVASKLAERETEHSEFLDNSVDVIYRLDLSGNLVSINNAAER
ncbi:MAG TPA: hypothetical protein VEZ90_00175, partial [Blastocatellia bacterium]|nr:hypothetical protein [Blastocatellia bacterium]